MPPRNLDEGPYDVDLSALFLLPGATSTETQAEQGATFSLTNSLNIEFALTVKSWEASSSSLLHTVCIEHLIPHNEEATISQHHALTGWYSNPPKTMVDTMAAHFRGHENLTTSSPHHLPVSPGDPQRSLLF